MPVLVEGADKLCRGEKRHGVFLLQRCASNFFAGAGGYRGGTCGAQDN
uniref:Uncharacterized protein n=1 Tax=Arundo donax TaxID=35708 RepID=A0A0A9FNL7_ARUDO